jgi:Acyl-CoA reductase (LuxC)
MKLQTRIVLFSKLGEHLRTSLEGEKMQEVIAFAKSRNPWFTADNIKNAILNLSDVFLNATTLQVFIEGYPAGYFEKSCPKKIGIIAAGNIPLVGFQDLIHVILSGHVALFKASSQDEVLIRYMYAKMIELEPEVAPYFVFVDRLNAADAFIATGSGNSSRYFEYYFAKKPHIIRKNRTSVAVLDGSETKIQLGDLGNDIFSFFGLGCRNVSKIFVPKGYVFDSFFEAIEYWSTIRMHSKYNNNYDYMKAIYLVNKVTHLDNGFLLLKNDTSFASPIAVLFYQEYEQTVDVVALLKANDDTIQAVISDSPAIENALPFGQSQCPSLGTYADNVDVMAFLNTF